MSTRERRDALARPYRSDHDRSVRAKARPPRDLLAWFLAGFREEMPERLHGHGVWHDEHHRGDPAAYQPVGGSALGAPRPSEAFRQLLEDDAFILEVAEYEGHKDRTPHYRYPMRAALARLAGRGPDSDRYPFMARALYRTVLRDGDWDGACQSMGIIEPVRWPYIEAALYRLWSRYETEPQARPYAPSVEVVAA
jgi:hypothetical protein